MFFFKAVYDAAALAVGVVSSRGVDSYVELAVVVYVIMII